MQVSTTVTKSQNTITIVARKSQSEFCITKAFDASIEATAMSRLMGLACAGFKVNHKRLIAQITKAQSK